MARKNHFVRYKKRPLMKRVEYMEQMSLQALLRYYLMFYKRGLIFADLVVMRRLGLPVDGYEWGASKVLFTLESIEANLAWLTQIYKDKLLDKKGQII